MEKEGQVEERIEKFFSDNWIPIFDWGTKRGVGIHALTKALKAGIEYEKRGLSGVFFSANYLMHENYISPDKETMDFLAKFFG
jgi:hypothetical protein